MDSDKRAYIRYPDGTYEGSVNGVVDTTWSGKAGAIRLIVPKASALLSVIKIGQYNAGFFGALMTSRLAAKYELGGVEIQNVNLPLAVEARMETGFLKSILIPSARKISLNNCPSLPVSNLYKIIDDMYQLYLDGVDLAGGELNLDGTTKVIDTDNYSARHGTNYWTMFSILDNAGVTITINSI